MTLKNIACAIYKRRPYFMLHVSALGNIIILVMKTAKLIDVIKQKQTIFLVSEVKIVWINNCVPIGQREIKNGNLFN